LAHRTRRAIIDRKRRSKNGAFGGGTILKRYTLLSALLVLVLTIGAGVGAQAPALTLELSGINAVNLPQVEVTVNVYDALGQPLNGLTAGNFRLSGPLAEVATIVRVENVANNALPFASVLVIDASDSMAGAPIEQARAAARAYVENVRPIDPVAVVAFGSTVELLQDFTTDRDALLAAIDSIDLNGRTALYQAAYDGVNLANGAPEPRRALVLLSDGAEYGGLSTVTPDDVFENAFLNGVPSYTIGLGFGADRSFLEQLAAETLAQFFESPSPNELEAIYQALADRLSSQYILTLDVNAPLDGAEYPFGLTVETDDASASQFGTVRAPIPVPVVDFSTLPAEPISEVTDLAITINADQDIARVTGALGGEPETELAGPPYTLRIDPVEYPPGPLTLDVTATDVDGDSGSGSTTLEIAALPPQISLSHDVSELGAIDEPLEITVNVFGQTPVTEVRVSLNGGEFVVLEAPYTFVLDPLELPPGDNHLDVVAVNESGLEAVYPADFIMAAVPPAVTVEGISDGQPVGAPVSFSINADGQTPVSAVVVTVNGEPLEPVDGVYTLDPQTVAPGAADLTVSVTTDNGQTGTASVTLMITPLPPVITIAGIENGQTVTGDVAITLDAVTQTPVISVVITINGSEVGRETALPATVTVPLSAMQPGENTLEVTVNTQAGQSNSVALTFNAPGSLFTPTPDALATGTASALAAATRTAVAAAAAGEAATQSAGTQIAATDSAVTSATQSAATAQAQADAHAAATQTAATASAAQAATATAQPQQTAQTQATASAVAMALTVTAEADAGRTRVAATASAAQAATATAQPQQTAQTQATASVVAMALTVTAEANEGKTQVAATSTAAQNATATAQAEDTRATASAVALALTVTAEADEGKTRVAATRTAVAQAATPTPAPPSATPAPPVATGTPTASSGRATAEAASVLVQQAATNAGATVAAQQTSAAVTQAAQATVSAATQAAQATTSAATQAENATSTREAQATGQAQTNQTATALAESISAATAQAGSTATQQAEATRAAQSAATATASANSAATSAAATQTAAAEAAEAEAQTATANAGQAAATAGAQATRTARAVLAAGTATAQATSEVTAEAQAAETSPTPQPTLTPVEVAPEQGGGTTTGLWAFFFLIVILAVLLVVYLTRVRKGRMRE